MDDAIRQDIAAVIETTRFVDTHEHLPDESVRISEAAERASCWGTPLDFSVLFANYARADLAVAGMPEADLDRFFSPGLAPAAKWRLVAPYFARTRHTGYMRAIRETVRILYEQEDLREDTCEAVSRAVAEGVRPGFYRRILADTAGIAYAQVNAVDPPLALPVFRDTDQPDLLAQDLSTMVLSTALDIETGARLAGRDVATLSDWHGIIDWAFETYGPRAIATKNQSAYQRRLDYAPVTADEAAPLFERYRKDPTSLSPEEYKAVQDHLFHYCVRKAIEYGLPVKLHVGYHAGRGSMSLDHVRKNASDLCVLLKAYPDARFDLFHINYPYQDEAIALAKHFHNAYIDMCWAWIINPAACVRFVKEFVTTAPINKLLTFGGDYRVVEVVPGHARVARDGLTQALTELVEERQIDLGEAPDLAARLMRGNAEELFDQDRALANWKKWKAAARNKADAPG